tara:strand:- start:54 stop:2000 length:1947 start_codon:yes stop_codon:yes gene_type:complete
MEEYLKLIKKYGLNEVKEQKMFLTTPEFLTPEKPLVLAGGTGFGKTFTTILKLIMFYLNPKNKGKKTIILPSSNKVLRNNFSNSFSFFKNLPFTYCVAEGKREFNKAVKSNCDVIIVLPQTLATTKLLPKVEWLVVDEAHKWYFAKTMRAIRLKTNPTYQLLLTGTPFKFNAKKDDYTLFYVPVEDMMAAGNIGNPLIEVVSSSINLKEEDFDLTNSNVYSNLKWSYKENKDQLISVAKEINKTLKTRFRTNTIGRMLGIFGIDKTIIYCYSKKQARHFYKIFQSSDLAGKVLLSDSESDVNSTEFAKFQNGEEYRILLVVDRGKEGFDMPELFNIVDFTLSTNPEIILQILGRLFRISKLQPNKQKMYYKVASQNTAPFILTLMTGILKLVKREYYETFTGSFTELQVPTMPVKRKKRGVNKNKRNFSTRALQYFQEANIPLTANFWNQLSFKQGDIWKTMGQTTLKQVINEMVGKGNEKIFRTYEQCLFEAKKYPNVTEWLIYDKQSYDSAYSNEWLYNIQKELEWKVTRKKLTFEDCFESAQKHNTPTEWFKVSKREYDTAYRHNKTKGWYDKCTAHMTKQTEWTLEMLMEIAKQYNTPSEWLNGHKKSYSSAQWRKDWYYQCTAHMTVRNNIKTRHENFTLNAK